MSLELKFIQEKFVKFGSSIEYTYEISALSVNGTKMKNVWPSLMVNEDESKLDNFSYVVNDRGQSCILANMSINFAMV